jgi:hypothetical protein
MKTSNDMIFIEGDVSMLPVCTLEFAQHDIEEHNWRRFDEMEVNGQSDLLRRFIFTHSKGAFVAEITRASGGGSVSADGVGDYCDVEIEYRLVWRIEP